jgi:hypothetical protein
MEQTIYGIWDSQYKQWLLIPDSQTYLFYTNSRAVAEATLMSHLHHDMRAFHGERDWSVRAIGEDGLPGEGNNASK